MCVADLVAVATALVVFSYTFTSVHLEQLHLSNVEQIATDWNQVPFLDFNIRPGNTCNPGESQPFNWTYKGTQDGCHLKTGEIITSRDYKAQYKSQK